MKKHIEFEGKVLKDSINFFVIKCLSKMKTTHKIPKMDFPEGYNFSPKKSKISFDLNGDFNPSENSIITDAGYTITKIGH